MNQRLHVIKKPIIFILQWVLGLFILFLIIAEYQKDSGSKGYNFQCLFFNTCIVNINGCQYLRSGSGYGLKYEHLGNCNNPIHNQNNTNQQ